MRGGLLEGGVVWESKGVFGGDGLVDTDVGAADIRIFFVRGGTQRIDGVQFVAVVQHSDFPGEREWAVIYIHMYYVLLLCTVVKITICMYL